MARQTITDISPQRRRKGRVNVYLNDKFWCGMSQELADELGLHRGQVISRSEQKRYEDRVVAREALDYCLRRLAIKRSSSGQLKEKLRDKGHSDQVIEATMIRLQELWLIDDEQYTRDLIGRGLNKGYWGTRISQTLDRASIDKDEGQALLAEMLAGEDEETRAHTALVKKYPEPLDINGRRKAQSFLARRGFSGAIARKVVDEHAMDPEQEAQIFTEAAARELLRRKRRIPSRDHKSRQKAFAYLMRQGFPSDIIRKALD